MESCRNARPSSHARSASDVQNHAHVGQQVWSLSRVIDDIIWGKPQSPIKKVIQTYFWISSKLQSHPPTLPFCHSLGYLYQPSFVFYGCFFSKIFIDSALFFCWKEPLPIRGEVGLAGGLGYAIMEECPFQFKCPFSHVHQFTSPAGCGGT